MLKFINLKNNTAKALIGILMIGGIVSGSSKQADASNGVQGIELRYEESSFQCGADAAQQSVIKIEVYDKSNDSLLTTLDEGDEYTSSDFDSISDFDLVYKLYNHGDCASDGTIRSVTGSELIGPNDPVPEVAGFDGQSSAAQIHSNLGNYEELLLVELGSRGQYIRQGYRNRWGGISYRTVLNTAYDLQDVVLVVDNNPDSLVDNAAPIAQPDTITTDEDNSTTYNLIAGDPNNSNAGRDSDPEGDTLYVTKFNLNGTEYTLDTTTSSHTVTMLSGAELTVNRNGDIEYNPNGQFEALNAGESASTPDRFTYTVADSDGATSTATATVNVNGAADDPEAEDDTFTMDEDTTRRIHVLNNDSDPNTDRRDLKVTQVNGVTLDLNETYTLESGATLTVKQVGEAYRDTNGQYTLKYDPTVSNSLNLLNDGESFEETFTYTVSDPEGNTDTGSVTVTVTGVTDTYAD